jgi:hypothetical protein
MQYNIKPLLSQLIDLFKQELPKSLTMQKEHASYLPKYVPLGPRAVSCACLQHNPNCILNILCSLMATPGLASGYIRYQHVALIVPAS